MVFGEGDLDDNVYAGVIDGTLDAGVAVGEQFTAEGVSRAWSDFHSRRSEHGFWGALASMAGDAAKAQEAELGGLAQCASSPICTGTPSGQYAFGHMAGSQGSQLVAGALIGATSVSGVGSRATPNRPFGAMSPGVGYSGGLGSSRRLRVSNLLTSKPNAGTVVIGRQMDEWVIPMASVNGAGYYTGTPAWIRNLFSFSRPMQRAVDYAFNKFWIEAQKAARKTIIDVGQRDASTRLDPSVFYNMEKRAIRNYASVVRFR